jgi:serine phosphatase RsbU (regulator of sigma subunit)
VLALTAALSWTAATANHNSNARLLELEVKQAAAAVTAALPSVQSQLLDSLLVETDTHNVAAFKRFSANKVGPTGFASVSLWEKTGGKVKELARLGRPPLLAQGGAGSGFLAKVRPEAVLQVTSVLPGRPDRLGYAEMPPGDDHYIVYAETLLPASHKLVVPQSNAFNDLNFALYFGPKATPEGLIESSVPTPVRGLRASATVPLGNQYLTIVGTPTRRLAGPLSAALPWIALGTGSALALASATTVEYVLRRRRAAESLAAENERLYVEQRGIAATLQHALLPQVPSLGSVEVAARYLPGVAGIDVGGDWYDVIHVAPGRCVFVVGDVSGRGLGAATTMASLRFATRAYVAQGDDPATVLSKLTALLDFDTTQRFATVLVADIDIAGHRLTLASAGHLPPLVANDGKVDFVAMPTGTPVGIAVPDGPGLASVEVQAGSLVLAFTDGLVERRGEDIEEGLERLRQAVVGQSGPLESVLDRLAAELVPAGAGDDMVLLGLRWRD